MSPIAPICGPCILGCRETGRSHCIFLKTSIASSAAGPTITIKSAGRMSTGMGMVSIAGSRAPFTRPSSSV